MSAMN